MKTRTGTRFPSYRLHKATGQAVVTIAGRDIYLGEHGTTESKATYRRVIAEYLAGGCRPVGRRATLTRSRTNFDPDVSDPFLTTDPDELQDYPEVPDCLADCNGDRAVDVLDFFCFVRSFNAGEIFVDYNGDDQIDVLDFFEFVTLFTQGCQ